MEISKEEKEVMGNITDELWTFYDSIKSWLQNESASPEQQLAYTEDNIYVRSNAIHKIYKPLLEDLKAENDRLKGEFDKYFSQDWVKNNSSMVNPNKKG